uniref:FAD:protein FMN transferase n=1 Tax=Pseudomonas laurentiana TaxID=2364649 RepID=UPI0029C77FB8|nr:FAD:protein FMN transferase [Pseudomonas laurentiana]
MKTFSESALARYSLNGETMGTRYSAVFYAPVGQDTSVLHARLFQAVDAVDQQMSTWKPDSALMRLNALPVGEWMEIPDALLWVLSTALRIEHESQGAFDIGVGDLVNAWGFGAGGQSAEVLAANGGQTRHRASAALEIDFSTQRVRKRLPITLDLNGIAKGFGVDQLAHCLEQAGIKHYLVGIDGEMRAAGHKPSGDPWNIAIEKPLRGLREVMGVMELSDASIATSGDYRHWVERDGVLYSHTMDPARGRALHSPLAAVSVVATSCMYADAWATALMVLGPDEGVALAQQRGMDAVFLLHDGDGFKQIAVFDGQVQ